MNRYNVKQCYNCNKPLYPTELSNKDRNKWCNCDRVGVTDGWSGHFQKSDRKDWRKQR